MKRPLTILLLIFIGLSSYSQIKTTEIEIRAKAAEPSYVNEITGSIDINGESEVDVAPLSFIKILPTWDLTTNGHFEKRVIFMNLKNSFNIGPGYSDTGFRRGLDINATVRNTNFAGSLENLTGLHISYGHTSGASGGQINKTYGVFLEGVADGGTTITDAYGVYQTGISFNNYFQGKLGLGTINPDAPLHMEDGTANNSKLIIDLMGASGNTGLDLRSSSIGGGSYWIRALGDQETDAFVVKGNGYVGIGTENPSGRLEVANSGNSELVVRGGGTSHANAGIVLKATNGTNQRATGIFMHDQSAGNEWFAGRPYSNSDSYVIYRNPSTADHTRESSARNTTSQPTGVEPILTILGDGNVGIGTVSPSKRLEVVSETVDVVARFTSNDERVSLMLRDHTTSNGVGISGLGDDLQILTGSGSSIAATFNGAKNLGLGTTNPGAKIHTVTGGATNFTWSPSSGTSAIFESATLNRNFLTIAAPGQSELWFADVNAQNAGKVRYVHSVDRMEFWTNNSRRVSIIDGNMGIGTHQPSAKLQVEGDIISTNMHSHSDRRWKKDISMISDAQQTLNDIRPVSYQWRVDEFPEKDFDNEIHYGVIAQELEKVLPELVSTDNEGYKSVDYLGMIGLLVKGFQERGAEIERLKQELENKDLDLEARLAKIEKALAIRSTQQASEKSTQ